MCSKKSVRAWPLQTDKQIYFFTLSVPYVQCEALYQQGLPDVVVTAENGKRIQIPCVRLRPFIDSRGLVGRFRLTVNANNKIEAFERVR